MFEAPTPRNKPSAPSGSLLQLPPPAVAASAIASEQAEKSANEQREAIRDEMNKRLMNIAEEQEKLRVRVSKLEAENSLKAVAPPPLPVTTALPTPPAVITLPTTTTEVGNPPGSALPAPGNPVPGMPSGPHQGKFLRKKEGEKTPDFKARFELSDADLDWWLANQAVHDAAAK